MTTTAAIYARLSQDRDGTKEGTERQEKDCRALCKREGFKVAEVFVDDDRSVYNGKTRPAFERLLADLDRFDVLVFWKTDRLVRRFSQFARVLERCEEAGVRLVSVVDPIDTSTPILKGVAGLMASMGEQESKNISLRVSRFHEEAARKGRPHGHRRAFGYDPTGTVIIEKEAEAIREARDRILEGESMRSICDDWNRRGVKPTSAPAWRVTTFKRMITGPRIAGLRQYRGEVVATGTWSAIITPDDRTKIIAVLGDPKVRTRGRPASYLLTGKVRCGRCSAVLRNSTSRTGRRWACRRVPGDDSHCGKLSVVATYVDDLVEAAVLYRLDSPALRRALKRTKSAGNRANAADLDVVERQIIQLGLDHDAGLVSRREWLERRSGLVTRLDTLRAELAAPGTEPLQAFQGVDVAERWAELSLDARRAVVDALIEHVTINPSTISARVFDPDRVDITWRA